MLSFLKKNYIFYFGYTAYLNKTEKEGLVENKVCCLLRRETIHRASVTFVTSALHIFMYENDSALILVTYF